MRTSPRIPVRCAPPGKVHHLLADALPVGCSVSEFGPDGARAASADGSIIVTRSDMADGREWCHASIAHTDRDPTYEELKFLHAAVFGTGWAYQVFAPPSSHINIHEHALHLWGHVDGGPVMPDFGAHGSI